VALNLFFLKNISLFFTFFIISIPLICYGDTMTADSKMALAKEFYKKDPQFDFFNIFEPPADYVMFGDSITASAMWNDIFPNQKIINRGIVGDRIYQMPYRIFQITKLKPKIIFINGGLNDINDNRLPEEVFEDYKFLVKALEAKGSQIVIQSTFECNEKICGKKLSKIRKLNSYLYDFANKNNIRFINVNEEISSLKIGLLPEYTRDGYHLLSNGYLAWSKKIAPFILN